MSTAPGRSPFPSESGSGPATGPGADRPARRARTVAAVAAAGTVAALTGFFAVRAAQADGADSPVTRPPAPVPAPPSLDQAPGTGSSPQPRQRRGFDRGFDVGRR